MTCPCDDPSTSLDTLEHVLAWVKNAADSKFANHGLSFFPPGPCALLPYPAGATTEQKKCGVRAGLKMLVNYINCLNSGGTQSEIEACCEDVCDEYGEDFDACFAA